MQAMIGDPEIVLLDEPVRLLAYFGTCEVTDLSVF